MIQHVFFSFVVANLPDYFLTLFLYMFSHCISVSIAVVRQLCNKRILIDWLSLLSDPDRSGVSRPAKSCSNLHSGQTDNICCWWYECCYHSQCVEDTCPRLNTCVSAYSRPLECSNGRVASMPNDGCSLLPLIVWKFWPFVLLQSASGRFWFSVPQSGTTCTTTRDLSVFPFLLRHYHMTHVTITIYHHCMDTCGACNN